MGLTKLTSIYTHFQCNLLLRPPRLFNKHNTSISQIVAKQNYHLYKAPTAVGALYKLTYSKIMKES